MQERRSDYKAQRIEHNKVNINSEEMMIYDKGGLKDVLEN